jgi:hypothetical protein
MNMDTAPTMDYNALRYGLFIHWNAGISAKSPHTQRTYADLCDVEAFAFELGRMGFEFVWLTNFHGRGTVHHPSGAIDFWRQSREYTSDRDLVRELIDALKKRDICLCLFTHPLDGHDFSPEQQKLLGFGCGDLAADVGPGKVDIYGKPGRERTPEEAEIIEGLKEGKFKKWNDFINDVYADIAKRYGGDIAALGFDSAWGTQPQENIDGVKKLDLPRLQKTIRQYAPHLPLVALSPANETTSYSIKEVWRPSWLDPFFSRGNKSSDYEGPYDAEDWPCYYRHPAIVITDHWAPMPGAKLHLGAEDMFRYAVMQIASAVEGPGIAWGNSPYIDGGWEAGVEEALVKVGEYMNPIREGLRRVYPSFSWFTKEGTKLGELPGGICATRSADDKFEYIFVLYPPDGKILRLPPPSDGKRFTKAVCLNTGEKAALDTDEKSGEVLIEIGNDSRWDALCTAIKLWVDEKTIPARSLAFHKTVTYSSSAAGENLQNSPYAHFRLVDGIKQYITKKEDWAFEIGGWRSEDGDLSPWVAVDLHKVHDIAKAVLHPIAKCGAPDGGMPLAFNVMVSEDHAAWRKVFEKTLTKEDISRPTAVECIFEKNPARYVKIECVKTSQGFFSLSELEIF